MFRYSLIIMPLLAAGLCHADVTSIRPPDNPTLGNAIGCTASDDGTQPTVTSWSWYATGTTPKGTTYRLGGMQGGSSFTFPGSTPGTYTVGVVVSYAGRSGQPKPPSPKTLTTQVTIPPPDGNRIAAGSPAETAYYAANTLLFDVMSRGNVCGGFISGIAQERKLDIVDWFGVPQPNEDWWPTSAANTFHLIGPQIIDMQAYDSESPVDETWPTIPLFATLTWTQQLRIHFTYMDSSTSDSPLPPDIHYTYTKTSPADWSTVTN
jgi:hypothetical protein